MRERDQPVTQTIKASEARAQWGQLLNAVFRRQKRIVVEKGGIPVAALVSAEDLQRLRRWEEEQTRRFEALQRVREPFRDTPPEEIEREVRNAITALRAEDAEHPAHQRV